KGRRVTVHGPFPPGATFVQVAYALPGDGGTVDIAQKFPANTEQLAVIVKKVGATTFTSPQIPSQREMPAEGETYIAGIGGAVPAGQTIRLSVSGFPHHSTAPRTIALILAGAIAVIGIWAAQPPKSDETASAAERKRLIS